ncbi:hypothetical protein H6P81_005163 [Aristolochia fimbriata]|uniref:Uncharacterized protein n=1 Tax=Aristolochia fimbriata TaxID=158543 RepID=A0AAV7EV37_ARIFI|nr:hypothetical protein H6P81_005163 [Aristolochia fimbriata]
MAAALVFSSFTTPLVSILVFVSFFEFSAARYALTATGSHWSPAEATWYGSPDGAGSTGGACGYGEAVAAAPFSSMITSGSPSLFMSGKGCGTCYQVKCTGNEACSKKPVRVVVTDSCPGCESPHFDLSGAAFGAMALPGRDQDLRAAGRLQIQYARVACEYPGKTLTFRVDSGSNPSYFSVVVEFEDGDGDLSGLDLREATGEAWRSMIQSWGADWKLDAGSELKPPFSLRLTSAYSDQTLVAKNHILQGQFNKDHEQSYEAQH